MVGGAEAALDLPAVVGQLAAILVQYGLPALLVFVLLYVERLAEAAVKEKRIPPAIGTTVFAIAWVSIFALIGLVAWQMIDDRLRRTWVAKGEVVGVEPPLRLELYDDESYLREVPPSGPVPRRHIWAVLTSFPLRGRCLELRVVGEDGLPLRPASYAVPMSSDRTVSLRYDPQTKEMSFLKESTAGPRCPQPNSEPTQAARLGVP